MDAKEKKMVAKVAKILGREKQVIANSRDRIITAMRQIDDITDMQNDVIDDLFAAINRLSEFV